MHVAFPQHIPFGAIAAEFGTPTFVLDIDVVRKRLSRFLEAFPPATCDVFYSIKANPNPTLINFARFAGVGVDICSEGDLWIARHCRVPSDRISCTGIALTDKFMHELGQDDVLANLDSISELHRWIRVTGGQPAGIRVAPDIRAGFSEHCQSGCWGGKFGFSIDDVQKLLRSDDSCARIVRGIHTHVGSGVLDSGPHQEAVRRLLPLLEEFSQLDYLNLGGGFGTSYHDEEDEIPIETVAAQLLEMARESAERRGKPIRIQLEPGEFIAAPAGYLLSKVMVKKEWHRGSEHREALILDASMNHFPAGILYGSMNRMWVASRHDAPADILYDVYGNTNQSGDRFGGPRRLPQTDEGDLIVLGSCGAYASCRGSNFNEHPLAAEVIVDGDAFRLAVRKQSYLELFGRIVDFDYEPS